MTMTRKAIEKVLEIGTIETHKIGEQTYSTQRLHLVQEPTPAEITVRSLSGLVGYVKSEFDTTEPVMIHIVNPTTVSCFTAVNGDKAKVLISKHKHPFHVLILEVFMTEKNLILHCNQVL